MIMPKDVRIVRPLFFSIERILDLIKTLIGGFNLNILSVYLAVFDNDHPVGLTGQIQIVGD